ncbi:hypothetical protein [Leptolyngbya sp. GB1-A1]|uniref:hypothetical protein n=1 Tax=unclassified Leptolyngbya TaxID=2650499 RepID=UPI0019AC5E18|nr:hypothetical protein [Cyanobacteria bacterium FACHB-502]
MNYKAVGGNKLLDCLKNRTEIICCNHGMPEMSRNINFYQNVLKLEVLNCYEAEGQLSWALLRTGEVEFMVVGAEPTENDDRDLLIYFQTEDMPLVQHAVQTAGYSLEAFREAIYEPAYELVRQHQHQKAAAAA